MSFQGLATMQMAFNCPFMIEAQRRRGVLGGELAEPYYSNSRMMFPTPLCSTVCESVTAA